MPLPSFLRSNGKLYVDPIHTVVRPYFLTLNGGVQAVPAGATVRSPMNVNQDAHFEGFDLLGETDDAVTPNGISLTIRSPHLGWTLMNRPIHWNTLIGTNLFPYAMPSSLFVPRTQVLEWTYTNLTAGAINVRNVINGRAFYWQKAGGDLRSRLDSELSSVDGKVTFPYWLTTDTNVVLPNLTETLFNMTVPQQFDFEVWKISAFSTNGAFSIRIYDSYSGQFMFNQLNNVNGILSTDLFGNNTNPFEFREPMLMGANTKITVFLTTVAAPNTIFLTFGGRAILKGDAGYGA